MPKPKTTFKTKNISLDILKLLADKQTEVNSHFSYRLELLNQEINNLKREINPKSPPFSIPVLPPPIPSLECKLIEITDEIIAIFPNNCNKVTFFDFHRKESLFLDWFPSYPELFHVIEGVKGSEDIFATLREKYNPSEEKEELDK